MNENLLVWTSDWHVTSSDEESGVAGDTKPSEAAAVAAYIASLEPAGVIDTGDCKDQYGLTTGDELAQYIANVRDVLPWAQVNPGSNAEFPILPGNHDEVYDYAESGQATDFSPFDAAFWGAPYHWDCDWEAPQIRLIAVHTKIDHSLAFGGFADITQVEVDWLEEQLDDLPANWYAFVCAHFPANPTFGNYVNLLDGAWKFALPHSLRTLLAERQTQIVGYLNGHRHANLTRSMLDGVAHFNGPAMSYTQGNQYGGFVPITYDPALRTLTLDYLYGPPHPGGYTRFAGFTPLVVQLPPIFSLTGVRRS